MVLKKLQLKSLVTLLSSLASKPKSKQKLSIICIRGIFTSGNETNSRRGLDDKLRNEIEDAENHNKGMDDN